MTHEEAKQKLQTQIDKGKTLLEQPGGWNFENVKRRREEYYSWDTYNGNLLRALFTTDEHRSSYHFGLGGRTEFKNLPEEVSDLLDDIRYKTRQIQDVYDEIDLIQLDPSIQASSSVTDRAYGQGTLSSRKRAVSNKVFIVHGHDDVARLEVANVLQKLKLQPIILNEQLNQGLTVIEKIERHSDVAFAVVLLTPDDVGQSKQMHDEGKVLNGRARQNVIFEMGYFYAKLTRSHVCVLLKGATETPSDISGVVYTQMEVAGAWKLELANEMKGAGLPVTLDDLYA